MLILYYFILNYFSSLCADINNMSVRFWAQIYKLITE